MILAAGTLAQASFSTASVGLPALAPEIRTHYRLSLGETGVVLAAIGIGMLFTLLLWGLVADRFDERWVIAAGLVGAGVALGGAAETARPPPPRPSAITARSLKRSARRPHGSSVGSIPIDTAPSTTPVSPSESR